MIFFTETELNFSTQLKKNQKFHKKLKTIIFIELLKKSKGNH